MSSDTGGAPAADTDADADAATGDTALGDALRERDADLDPDADVILKSEWHFITDDTREELALIRTGAFDAVVFEAARENVEEIVSPSISDRIVGFPFFFLGFLYTDTTPLLVAALNRGADVRYTRDADGDVIQDLPDILHGGILGVVLVLAVCVAYFAARAITTPLFAVPSFAAFAAIFATPITIRYARGLLATGETNRNEIMAQRITAAVDAADDGARVFAPVGARHTAKVRARLPERIDADVVPAAHGFLSVAAMREFIPGVAKSIVLFVAVWLAAAGFGALLVLAAYTAATATGL